MLLKNNIKKIIARLIPSRLIWLISKLDPRDISKKSDYFWGFIRIDKKMDLFEKRMDLEFQKSNINFGIIIQGPLIKEENFTCESLKLLKYNYPNSKIVLSTWENENEIILKQIEKLGIYVIRNKYPYNGLENLNYQIFSTKQGIKKLKGLGVEYVLKTRTDQRINEKNIDLYLINLLKAYPVASKYQKERIIGLDINTYKYLPFSFSDMFQFGHILDLEIMWSVPLTTERFTVNDRKRIDPTIRQMEEYMDCEMYLHINFLKKTNFDYNYSLRSYFNSLKERYIVIDKNMINLYWFKYSSIEIISDKLPMKNQFIKHIDWLNIYNNFESLNFEELLKIEEKVFEMKLY